MADILELWYTSTDSGMPVQNHGTLKRYVDYA